MENQDKAGNEANIDLDEDQNDEADAAFALH